MRKALSLLVFLAISAVPLAGQALEVYGESDLSAWAMDADLMVSGTADDAERLANAPCGVIHASIDDYLPPSSENANTPGWVDFPWSEDIWHMNLTPAMVASLVEMFGWLPGDIQKCTQMHVDGWLQANEYALTLAGNPNNPLIEVTAEGPMQCSNRQALIASASYYWDYTQGRWDYFYGTTWAEDYWGGYSITADMVLRCVEIVEPTDPDFADVAADVPNAQVNYNPLVVGLTGLDTWLWYEFTTPNTYSLGPKTVSVSAYGREWTLTAHAWIDAIHWDLDCESQCDFRGPITEWDDSGVDLTYDFADTAGQIATVYDGGGPSDDDALAVHLYEEKGDYTVATATVWRGYYTSLGVPYLYDPVVVVTSRPYLVQEIRGVLTTPEP